MARFIKNYTDESNIRSKQPGLNAWIKMDGGDSSKTIQKLLGGAN